MSVGSDWDWLSQSKNVALGLHWDLSLVFTLHLGFYPHKQRLIAILAASFFVDCTGIVLSPLCSHLLSTT
jgi:hypothetical protein